MMALALLLSGISLAQSNFCDLRNTAFAEGEHIYFKVWYNMSPLWVGAGEAHFRVYADNVNGRRAYHVTGDGKTLKSYEWFYKVRDRYETWIDAQNMRPLKFVRTVDEGGFKINDLVTFNHSAGQATSNSGTYKVPQCVQDVLSTIYFARSIDYNLYKPGAKIPFSMFLDDEVYNLYIRFIGREKIETRYGTFNAIKIVPLLIKGSIFKGGEDMTIWISDDANHIPLRIDTPILVGSIKVDMMGYDNLRNPLTSLIEKR
jgi:hypothetical protein